MKLKGLTEQAYKYLTVEDIELLEDFIGCEVYYVDELDLVMMPDNEVCHIDFLTLE